MKKVSRAFLTISLLLLISLLYGCCCHSHKDVATCGEGTRAISGQDGEITCVTNLTCAEGTHERRDSTTGLSACWSDLGCGLGTHEQGTGTRRECLSDLSCDESTLEQGTGTRRECTSALSCGEGTMEQGTGTRRQCVPDPTDE